MLFDLPLLPDTHIPLASEILEKRLKAPALSTLMQYVGKNWIRSHTWLSESWSMFQEFCRCRGLALTHHSKASRTTLQLYMLVPLLHQEAQHVDITANLLSTNKLKRYFKKDTIRIQKRLNQRWKDYNTREMLTSLFLRKAGSSPLQPNIPIGLGYIQKVYNQKVYFCSYFVVCITIL